MRLRARPLLRALRQLAGRALIQLPPEVDELLAEPAPPPSVPRPAVSPGPIADAAAPAGAPFGGQPPATGDTFGLSKRELEVLALIARAARTARSATGCSSARRRSASTSATSCPSSACPAGSRRRRSRSASGSRTGRPRRAAVSASAVPPTVHAGDRRVPEFGTIVAIRPAVFRGSDASPPHRRPRRHVDPRRRVRLVDPARVDVRPAHATADPRTLGVGRCLRGAPPLPGRPPRPSRRRSPRPRPADHRAPAAPRARPS